MMNPYLAELKKITENYENYQRVDELQTNLYGLSSLIENDTIEAIKAPLKASDLVSSVVADFFKTDKPSETVQTGFKAFDRAYHGFERGEYIVIGARPGMGKTQFMVQLATNMGSLDKGVAFLSLEMTAEMMTKKFLCNLGKLPPDVFNRPEDYNDSIELSLSEAIKQLKDLPIFLYENPSTNLNKLMALIKQLVSENKVSVIFLDYLQLISVGSRRYNREAEIAIVCRDLKKLAMELGITIIVSSQLSRQVENRPGGCKRPQLSDLRESGAIEQDADKVIFLYRAEYYGIEVDENNQPTKNLMELMVGKNRNGNTGDVRVYANLGKSTIVDMDYSEEQNYKAFFDIKIDPSRLNDLNSNKDISEIF